MNIQAEVAKQLLQIKAIKLSPQNPFTWSSGLKSPIYCDNRKILSFPIARNFIKQALATKSKDFGDFDIVAGVATAGIAHGALLADALDKPFVYVRNKAKGHGLKNLIEGHLVGNEKVLVVEDLISTGGSSLKAVEALRAAGTTVIGVLAIFNYNFDKAANAFSIANCPYQTLSNYNALLPIATEMGYVTAADLTLLQNWRKNPSNWQ